jgi:hypothetical protein
MPFSKSNADLFYRDVIGINDGEDGISRPTTTYAIEIGNTKVNVDTFESWRNCESAIELKTYGKMATPIEKAAASATAAKSK